MSMQNPGTPMTQPQGTDPQGNGMAVTGFICALVSIVLFWVPFLNFIVWVLGIVFSAIGLNKANKQQLPYRGLSIAGLVIALVPGTLLIFVVFLVVMAAL